MRTRPVGPTILAALVLAGASGASLAAQSNEVAALRVRVTDAATGLPIEGAQVGFPELSLFTLANAGGIAQIPRIPPGPRTLEVSMLGYGTASATIELEAHAVATGDIALTADPIEIEGLTVTASAQIQRLRDAGFYQRERMGIGHQVGPLEIASMIAFQTADLFTMVPSVRVLTGALGSKYVESVRSCATLSSQSITAMPGQAQGLGAGTRAGPFAPQAGSNAMAVYLDGVPWRDALDRIQVEWIAAAEVYVGSQVPVQWSTGRGACGVILIWSK